ncbi:MAG TPA: AAA family ATPase, partial [Bacilli bacterium]
MLTSISVNHYKKLKKVEIELGKTTVFIGPNNSGKTTALQALALWEVGLKKWLEKRGGKTSPEKRPGVTINRRDLLSIPVPFANLLWHNLHVRNVERIKGKTQTQNICIEVIVEGVSNGQVWKCGLEFDYANEESFYCRPLRKMIDGEITRMPIPAAAGLVNVAFLPPMSGLAAYEPKWEPGRINVLLGEGQTAQVLRNMCYQIYEKDFAEWKELVSYIKQLFGVSLLPPKYIQERGEITMSYVEENVELDLASAGRGLQQTLLILSHLYANPETVLLLDEPDAHLEVLRQREIYSLITSIAEKKRSQIIAASHSEVVLNEAASKDTVIAFVGTPHRIDDRGSQVLKSLKEIGYDQYYQAEQTGWVLYLEGSTDLAILIEFSRKLNHPLLEYLSRPFVYYVGNQVTKARDHFYGLKEAKKDLLGIAIFDRTENIALNSNLPLIELMWKKREIENYFCSKEVLLAYSKYGLTHDLFG